VAAHDVGQALLQEGRLNTPIGDEQGPTDPNDLMVRSGDRRSSRVQNDWTVRMSAPARPRSMTVGGSQPDDRLSGSGDGTLVIQDRLVPAVRAADR
jgi:hypothetical protein